MDVGRLVRATRRYGGRIAVDGPQGRQSFAELGDRVMRLARGLLSLGLEPGARVLDLQTNQNTYLETDLAMATAGLTRVALNHRLHRDDWARIADDSGASALVYDARFADQTTELRSGLGNARTVVIGDGPGQRYEALIAAASGDSLALDLPEDSLVSLNYTSGTTGHPKGVRRTHRNRIASAVAMTADVLGGAYPSAPDVYLHAGPITHTSGLFALPFLIGGATQLIHPSYDPEAVVDAVRHRGVTHTALVPTMIARLLALPDPSLPTLKLLGYAGAPMPPEQIRQAYQRITENLVQYYGLVEAMPPVTVLDAADHKAGLTERPELLTSAGRPCRGVSLGVAAQDGEPAPAGEVGEVLIKGDCVMSGYWGAIGDEIKAVRDGWLHTGDLGRLGEGDRLWLVDRKGDMIITGGYNVYPREVEDVIAALPGVREVAVIGVPDPEWGQRVVALYTGPAEAEALAERCRQALAGYKKPKEFRRVEAFPLNATGKIAKNVLRASLSQDRDHERGSGR